MVCQNPVVISQLEYFNTSTPLFKRQLIPPVNYCRPFIDTIVLGYPHLQIKYSRRLVEEVMRNL